MAPIVIIEVLFNNNQNENRRLYRAYSSVNENITEQELIERVNSYLQREHVNMYEYVYFSENQNNRQLLLSFSSREVNYPYNIRHQGFWFAVRQNGGIAWDCDFKESEHLVSQSEHFNPNYTVHFTEHKYV
jgi:hypothetical protein